MPRIQPAISSDLQKLAQDFGGRLALARGRRKLSSTLFAERMGISRNTLARLESGDTGVALGMYLKALRILGLESSLALVAQEDPLGRKLQDQVTLEEMPGRGPRPPRRALPGHLATTTPGVQPLFSSLLKKKP
ncbi:helix-turn-helix domain-containing protein [Propionivibrio sp.]|uniref:helix-turn-helix domain-containing protein n=1 Tax=Propionivibrio sp. TaxID=2212460 RepID=UPI003BF2A621